MNENPTPSAREMDANGKPSGPMNLTARVRQAAGASDAVAAR
jgi:hypothetical protein